MKKIWALAFLISGTLLTSCEEDPFDDNEGDPRDVFYGTWTVAETSTLNGVRNYDITIEEGFGSRINMFNFYLLGVNDSVYGTVSTVQSQTVTLPLQTIAGNEFEGSGTLVNDNQIDFSYIVDDGNQTDTVLATATR